MTCCFLRFAFVVNVVLLLGGFSGRAIEPGDVIINELYFNLLDTKETNHFEAVELLVVKGGQDLNGLQVTDRDHWNRPAEGQCTLTDFGQGFLSNVPAGTLIVIYTGSGVDDIDPSDFVLRFFTRSSIYCNTAPANGPLRYADGGDNLHLLHLGRQIDFLKYKATKAKITPGDPGTLKWEGGASGIIEVGDENENVGFRFMGDKPELNDYPAAWRAYPEPYTREDNLGLPNGGRNTEWIEKLRKKKSS